MTPFALLVVALAAYRLTHLATADAFALRAIERLRPLATKRLEGRRPITGELLGERFILDSKKPLTWRVLYGLLTSHWTVGFGASGATVLLWSTQHGWFQWVAYALASSSGAGLIRDLTGKA